MIRDQQQDRTLREASLDADLVVVGGGLAGTCCAITAARQGAKVVLVQDRPVLGGNASSEVRLWVLGATSHMGSNNRWAREGGLINEILLDSVYRNPEGNPVLFDAILLDKAASEPSLTLLLNTAVHAVERRDDGGVASVRAFCSQNSTSYELRAPVFCDASGDGVVGFLAGAAFRFGAEARDEFDELYAPATEGSDLLGHSLYFYTRDTGQPVSFTAPSFALDDITTIPRYRRFSTQDQGCSLWWIEYGGLRDTVHDTEEIKWELWKVVYGVWDHIKNSGEFPDAETMTLEWIGTIPGKRESRRFEGDYMMSQRDIVERRRHNDAVSFGGWAIDHHPGEGVYSKEEPCTQWHSRGVYQIPYRCLYSRNTPNLFLAGRIISASHVAFGSTRVMATCAHLGQAVGMAAALCARDGLDPKELTEPGRIAELQNRLLQNGQHIPGVSLSDQEDLAQAADLLPSSEFVLSDLPACGDTRRLSDAMALLVPVPAGSDIEVAVPVVADGPTVLSAELRCDIDPDCYTPDRVLALEECVVGREALRGPHKPMGNGPSGRSSSAASESGVGLLARSQVRQLAAQRSTQLATFRFAHRFESASYAFLCLMPNEQVEVGLSDRLVSGVTTVARRHNPKVAKSMVQTPPDGIGIEEIEFWTPERWSTGRNLAAAFASPLRCFGAEMVRNGHDRPSSQSNAWVADPEDPAPSLTLEWAEPVTIDRVELALDCDYDDALEQVLVHHKDRVSQLCVRSFRIRDENGGLLFSEEDNHQGRRTVRFATPIATRRLVVELDHPNSRAPASLFSLRCYGPETPGTVFAQP